jgi:hypothetical protein
MRAFIIFCVGVLAAYWIDQTYSAGQLSQAFVDMFRMFIRAFS